MHGNRFPNAMCVTEEEQNGTCYTPADCEEKGGKAQVQYGVQLCDFKYNFWIIFDYFLPPGSGSIRRSFADPDPHNNDMLGKLCVGIRGLLPVRVHVLADHQRERNVLCEPGDAGADVQPPRQQNQRRHLPDSSRARCLWNCWSKWKRYNVLKVKNSRNGWCLLFRVLPTLMNMRWRHR